MAWPRISTALGQKLQVLQIIIFKTKTIRELVIRYGPRREKTCLRGLRQSETQTSLCSYRDYLENRNFVCSKLRYGAFPKANNKGSDQTLVCIFVVCKPLKTGFLAPRAICKRRSHHLGMLYIV